MSTIRYTGTSGVDVDSMVTQLMNAEKIKYNKVYRETELLKYKQDAYRGVGVKLSSIQKSNFDLLSSGSLNFRKSSTWSNSTTSIKNSSGNTSNAVSVSFSTSNKPTNFSVKVNSVAEGERFTSSPTGAGKIEGDGNVATANDVLDKTYSVTVNGTKKNISFTSDDLSKYGLSGSDSASALLEAKVKDTFGENTVSMDSSTGTITANEGNTFSISQVSTLTAEETEAGATEDLSLSEFGLGAKTSASTAITDKSTLQDIFGIADGESLSFSINGVDFNDFDSNTTMSDFINTVNNSDANVTLSYSQVSNSFTIASDEVGTDGKIDFGGDFSSIFGDVDAIRAGTDTSSTYKANSQAEIEYTDEYGTTTTLTRNSNSFDVDGVKITANKVTTEALDVTLENDSDTTISNIKEFVDKYNEMLEALYDEVDTSRPKSGSYSYYDPLTSEEREEMSETEQKNWDEKAKTGLLEDDDILQRIESQLRQAVLEPVTLEDGTKISLYDLGIQTDSDWTQKGRLVIDEEKLAAGVEKYGDKIDELFTQTSSEGTSNVGIANRINTVLTDAVGYSGTITKKAGLESSAVSLTTNDMYNQITNKEEELEDLLDYLSDKENHYYSIFSNMESYITQQNSQMSYLLSSLG